MSKQDYPKYLNEQINEKVTIVHHRNCPTSMYSNDYNIIHHENCFKQKNEDADYNQYFTLSNNIQDNEENQHKPSIEELMHSLENKDKQINMLNDQLDFYKNNNYNENFEQLASENNKLKNDLDFILGNLNNCHQYLNHFYNILFKSNKVIPLNKFNPSEVQSFLEAIENRIFELSNTESLLDIANKKLDESKNQIDKLNNQLKDLTNELLAKQRALDSQPNKHKFNKFTGLKQELVIDMDYMNNDNNENDNDDIMSNPATKRSKSKLKGKYKKIYPGNLYDKYSNKLTNSFFNGNWASDGFESIVVHNKVVKAEVVDKLALKPKQIIPVKPKTFAYLLNKQLSNDSKSKNDFIRRETIKAVKKHNFE